MSTLTLIPPFARRPRLNARQVRLIALGYAVKTLAFAVAWYFVPDLPQRLGALGTAAWAWLLAD
jgi:hypothetical protein